MIELTSTSQRLIIEPGAANGERFPLISINLLVDVDDV